MAKKKKLNTSKPRGKNQLNIKVTGKDPEKVADKIVDSDIDKDLNYFIRKNKPIKGKGYKPPKAVVIVKTVELEDGTTKTFSDISEPDFVVNKENIKNRIKSSVGKSFADFADFYNEEPERIKSIGIKFIY